jgi:glycosyltransferase involved in cell wall biosynthesis
VTTRPDLSVIIPVRNASATVVRLVKSFLAVDGIEVEVIAVDDASTDDSVELVSALGDQRVRVERLDANYGAGVARNRGFARAAGRYALFFDADDLIAPDALLTAIEALDATGADTAFTPYRYRRGEAGSFEGMHSYDHAVWSQYATRKRRLVDLTDVPRLLGFSNYPWNKVINSDHYRHTGLRFSSTPVHNDILGHWLTLLDARKLVLVDEPLCTHIVEANGANLTNRRSRARLTLFDALDETYDALEQRPAMRQRYSHHYWSFALRVADWARDRVALDAKEEFNLRLQTHLLRMDLADFARMRARRDPTLASAVVRRVLA